MIANRTSDCRDAVDKYLRNNPVIPGADTQTWEDVIRQLDDAETMYQAKGESSMIRRGMRHGQTISRTMLPLLEAIPNEKGLGLIKGGLLVIFNVNLHTRPIPQRSLQANNMFAGYEKAFGDLREDLPLL